MMPIIPSGAHRELDRRAGRQLGQLGGLHRRIVLPAEETVERMSPGFKSGLFDVSNAARAEGSHDLADLDRRQIGVPGDPGPLCRIAREHDDLDVLAPPSPGAGASGSDRGRNRCP